MLQKRINHYLLSATFTLFSYSANATKLSYQNILLEIDQNDYFPKKAERYLRSGKHAKTAI